MHNKHLIGPGIQDGQVDISRHFINSFGIRGMADPDDAPVLLHLKEHTGVHLEEIPDQIERLFDLVINRFEW